MWHSVRSGIENNLVSNVQKQNEDKNEGKLKDTEVVMTLFMCNINMGVRLQSFKNVTLSQLFISCSVNIKKCSFIGSPRKK